MGQALTGKYLTSLGSQQGKLRFLRPQYPIASQQQKNKHKQQKQQNFASDLMCCRNVFKHKHLVITVAPAR